MKILLWLQLKVLAPIIQFLLWNQLEKCTWGDHVICFGCFCCCTFIILLEPNNIHGLSMVTQNVVGNITGVLLRVCVSKPVYETFYWKMTKWLIFLTINIVIQNFKYWKHAKLKLQLPITRHWMWSNCVVISTKNVTSITFFLFLITLTFRIKQELLKKWLL